jgi:iron-sulfur cluster assembly protein
MIKITERAARQIRQAAEQSGSQGMPLRIAAQRKPDGSIDYAMGFDAAAVTDTQLQLHGVDIIVSATSDTLLEDTTLDFVELDEGGRQFIFLNPRDPNYTAPRAGADDD